MYVSNFWSGLLVKFVTQILDLKGGYKMPLEPEHLIHVTYMYMPVCEAKFFIK